MKKETMPDDVMAAPRCNYIQTLRRRIRELSRFADHCRAGEVSGREFEEMRLRVQSLAGSGATYGYDGVSEAAALLSRALNELSKVSLKKDASLAQRLLKACDHALAIEEESARQKASVSMEFRAAEPETLSAPPVLLTVDDDPAIHDLVQALFEKDAQIITAYDGDEAMRMMRQRRPDLILMDHYMPGVEGLKVLEDLHAGDAMAAVPVMMLTSDGQMETMRRAAKAGVVDYITKPFNPQEFAEKIYGFLHRFRMTVLVANDNGSARRSIGNRLRRQGVEVLESADAESVLAMARTHIPELIFLDRDVPGMDRQELLHGLREDPHTRYIPVLYLTVNDKGRKVLINLNTGPDNQVAMPFVPEKLTSHILNVLGLESRWA